MPFSKLLFFIILSHYLTSCKDIDHHNSTLKENALFATLTKSTFDTCKKSISTLQKVHKSNIPKSSKSTFLKAFYTAPIANTMNDKPFQTFLFNQSQDTTLYCKEGTVLKISKESFITTENDNISNSEIIIKVKEYYSIADIISAGLSTISNDQILETGGMLFIQSFANGKECELKNDSKLEISFPCNNRKDDMIAFSGSFTNGEINWSKMFPETILQTQKPAEYPGGAIALSKFLEKNIVYPDSLSERNIGGIEALEFVIDENGKPVDVLIRNEIHHAFKDMILKTFSRMQMWKPAMQNGIPVRSTHSQTITFLNSEGYAIDTTYKKDFEENNTDSTLNELKAAEIGYYVLSVSKLGWINCDRFYNNPKPKTDFMVKVNNFNDIDVKLVFHSFRSILQGKSISTGSIFKNVPTNEKITVVALKKTNNINYIAVTETSTSEMTIKDLHFERVTLLQLKSKLEQLNSIE